MENKKTQIVIWDDIVMMILALVSGYLLVLEYTTSLTPVQLQWLNIMDVTIASIFLLEFAVKFFLAKSKSAFFKANWWYLLASIPVTTSATQALRLLRLLRLFRLLRLSSGVKEVVAYLKRFVKQTHLFSVFAIWAFLMFAGTLAFYAFEHAVNPHVNSLFDSFWWAMATVTTIGYGDIYPTTTAGRIVAMFLMITGIGTSGIFTALIASFLIKEKK